MANICSCNLHIEGNKETIASLTKKITDQNDQLIELFYWFEKAKNDYGMWEDTFTPEPESINLSFGCKWAFPCDEFENLVKEYPSLEFSGSFEESGCEVYGKVSASEGIAFFTNMTPLDYFTEFNEDFATERNYIEKLSYKEFLKYTLDNNKDENDLDWLWCYLEPFIIDRIERKDLPLFIDREWHSEEDTEKFTTKLKGE